MRVVRCWGRGKFHLDLKVKYNPLAIAHLQLAQLWLPTYFLLKLLLKVSCRSLESFAHQLLFSLLGSKVHVFSTGNLLSLSRVFWRKSLSTVGSFSPSFLPSTLGPSYWLKAMAKRTLGYSSIPNWQLLLLAQPSPCLDLPHVG